MWENNRFNVESILYFMFIQVIHKIVMLRLVLYSMYFFKGKNYKILVDFVADVQGCSTTQYYTMLKMFPFSTRYSANVFRATGVNIFVGEQASSGIPYQ